MVKISLCYSSTDHSLVTDSLVDMNLEEELVENFADSFTTPLYIYYHLVIKYTLLLYHNITITWQCGIFHLATACLIQLKPNGNKHWHLEKYVALTVIFLRVICFVLCVKKTFYWRYRKPQNTGLNWLKRRKLIWIILLHAVKRNCRKKWYLESNPRRCRSAIRSAYNTWHCRWCRI